MKKTRFALTKRMHIVKLDGDESQPLVEFDLQKAKLISLLTLGIHQKIARAVPATKESPFHMKDWCANSSSNRGPRRDRDTNDVRGARAWMGPTAVELGMTVVLNAAQEKT